jgi:hypothetical protein
MLQLGASEPPDNKVITSLLKAFTPEQRKKWLSENVEYKACTSCCCINPDIKKCIHHDCPGMCANCFDTKNKPGFEDCSCCGQKQEMTCPICQDDFTPENLVKSEGCNHQICWGCFGRSVKSSRPLSHCPMCRVVFCDKLIGKDDTDDDSFDPFDIHNFVQPSPDEASDNNFDAMLLLELQNGTDAVINDPTDSNFDHLLNAIDSGAVTVRNTSSRTV